LSLCLALAAASPGRATTATARPDRKEVHLGGVFVVTVLVKDAPTLPTVRPESAEDCLITPLGPGQRATDAADGGRLTERLLGLANRISGQLDSMPNGKDKEKAQAQAAEALKDLRRGDYVFPFRVQPEKAGPLTVPAFSVAAGGEKTMTQPFEIRVCTSGPTPWVHLEWGLSNPRPRVGEDVQLFLDLRMDRRPTSLEGRKFLHLPLRNILLFVPGEKDLPMLHLRKTLEDVTKEHATPPGKAGFWIKGLPQEVLFEQIPTTAGEEPARFRYRLPLPVRFPRAGTFALPPVRAVGEVYVPAPQAYVGTKKLATPASRWVPFAETGKAQQFEVAGR
jgi:hypothetical protein